MVSTCMHALSRWRCCECVRVPVLEHVHTHVVQVAVSACDWAWEYVHYHSRARGCEDYHTSCSADDPAVACDAVQGYIVTK